MVPAQRAVCDRFAQLQVRPQHPFAPSHGPGLGLDVLDDCVPSAALLLLIGHDFPDSEALLETRGAHLPEVETLYVGRWKVGVRTQGLEWEIGLGSRAPGQFGQAASIWRVLQA